MSRYFYHSFISDYSDNTFTSGIQIKGKPEHYRVSVKLRSSKVEFVYYDVDDIAHPVTPGQLIPLFSIPLDDPMLLDRLLLQVNEINFGEKILNKAENRLYYIDVLLENKSKFNSTFDVDEATLFELLLCFFDEINNPESDLYRYSHVTTNEIKRKFEKSYVYRLIIAKYQIYSNLKDWYNSGRSSFFHSALKNSACRYLAMLTDDNLLKTIPKEYFSENNWFDTPENEIETLIKIDKLRSEKENLIFNQIQLNEIQAFYYRKHSFIAAWKQWSSKYFIPLAGHLIALIIFLLVFIIWLHKINLPVNLNFSKLHEASRFILFTGLGVVVFSLILQWAFQGFRFISLLPRILIATAAAWAVIVPSEELIKNLINVESALLIGLMVVLPIIIYSVIYAQCRSKSPYYNAFKWKRLHNHKALPIMIYVFNIAVLFGVISHHFIINDFISKSNILQKHVFKSDIITLNRHKDIYLNYESQLNTAMVLNSGVIRSLYLHELYKYNDTLQTIDLPNTTDSSFSVLSMHNFEKEIEMYNDYINSIRNIAEIDSRLNASRENCLVKYSGKDILKIYYSFLAAYDTLIYIKSKSSGTKKEINDFLTKADSILFHHFLAHGSEIEVFRDSARSKGIQEIKSKPLAIKSHKQKYIYTKMLIIQVFIAMFITVIGNLIVSDKTITEGL